MKAMGRFVQELSCVAVVMAAAIGFAAGKASAADTSFTVNPKSQLIGNAVRVLDLDGGSPGTDFIVFTTADGALSVFFNAECSVAAPNDTTYVSLDILVDGSFTAGNFGTDRAFCTSTGDNALQHWVSAAANVVRNVSAGSHTIRVRARLIGGTRTDRGQIDDITLIVIQTP